MQRILSQSIPMLLGAVALCWPGGAAFAEEKAGSVTLGEHIVPMLKTYCTDCHNPDKQKGDLDLTKILDNAKLVENRDVWERVVEVLEAREMPPEKKPQPSDHEREQLAKFVDSQLSSFDCNLERNPGKVTIRRLNREEYRNTVRDLLKVDYYPEDFPNDEVGYGFDNIADVLSLPPMLMEKFLAAAEEIVNKAIVLEAAPRPQVTRLPGDRFKSTNDSIKPMDNHALGLYRDGEAQTDFMFPQKGEYTFRIHAAGDQAGPEAPKLAVRVGGKELAVFDVKAKEAGAMFEVRASLDPGPHKVAVAYLNNYSDADNPNPKLRGDRNLYVNYVEVVTPPLLPSPAIVPVEIAKFRGTSIGVSDGWLAFTSNAEAIATVDVPKKDEYIIRVRARGEQAGGELPKLGIAVGGREIRVAEIAAGRESEEVLEARVTLDAGAQKLGLAFLNDYYDLKNPDPKLRGDRNLSVRGIELIGPLNAGAVKLPESHRALVPTMPVAGQELEAARTLLRKLVPRAYRRPATDAEIERLVGFVDLAIKEKGNYLEGLQVALQAVLCSPKFLFRWELDPETMKEGDIRDLSSYEVASRLSYFLWSSMPDEELLALAQRGELLDREILQKQVTRMLGDWKAHAFVANFAGQWLQIRNMFEIGVDPTIFPNWDDSLKGAMKEETERFFEAIMKEDRPVTDLLEADFTFLNEKLARHYGIEGVKGEQFRRVTLPADSPRGGVLTQGSVLLATSTPTRTSPVIRGKWILEQILGTPPPPPPPDVPALGEQKNANQLASLRQRLEEHRSRAECAGCHAMMDPLGFALENFDATGAWRTTDGNFPIDASGKLRGANGKTFNGPKELKGVLKDNKNFVNSLTTKMMIYALGRGLEYFDKCAVTAIAGDLQQNGNRFSTLIAGIVTSDPFLKRKREITSR